MTQTASIDPVLTAHDKRRREALGLFLGFVGVVIFGGTLPFTRLALEVFSPWFVTFGRAAVASVAAGALLYLSGKRLPRADIPALLATGLLLVFGFPVLSSFAMQTVPAAHGGVVLGILPLATSVFAALIAGDRPSPLFWICAVAGAVIVVAFSLRGADMRLSSGDTFLFLAAISASLGYVIAGKLSRKMPGWEVICWALVLTAPVTFVATALSFEPAYLDAGARHIAALAYLSFGSMFLGFFFWNVGLAMGGIARVSQVQLLQSFVTMAIAAFALGEIITLDTMLFALAVIAVVALGRRARVAS